MKMIGFEKPFKLEEGNLFKVYEQRKPTPENDDILVKVNSISVNPVDTKQRQMEVTQAPRVLGFDAIGTVEAIGPDVTLFSPGDVVFYAGSPNRQGSNATYQLVSEAIVAKAPHNISANEAVSLPLTGITAYETFFDTFKISHNPSENVGKSVLIINGAGGVGSIATQIAKRYGLTVITTASRQEITEWCEKMGADIVLNHKEDLVRQFKEKEIPLVDYIFCTYNTDLYYNTMIELIKPLGHITTIVAFNEDQDLNALKLKSITFTHEFMFARPIHRTPDMIKQHEYLEDITKNIESGHYQPTTTQVFEGLSPENLYQAHLLLEKQSMIGKLVINI
ncbi:TPA: zinc-binding alcohol dehydrogenase family protein [Staphylococcus aureus]|nr:zinc-binding alcohol dehydrogenase family protein [Staphylococcus aureus]